MKQKTVIVIGGGAAGLTAAITAAANGAAVTLLERLPRVGKKILLTGNGRCNLGHDTIDAARVHGSFPAALQMMQQFDADAFFRRFGLFVRTDAEGRMYPASGMAASVLDALRFAAEQQGVQTVCEKQVTGLRQTGTRWQVQCGETRFSADAVIAAAGGSAAPSCGTDGNLLPVLQALGLKVIPPKPALCPIPTDTAMVKPLKGLRVRAEASAVVDGNCLKTERGEVQFTDNALSGICIFNLSRLAAQYGKRMTVTLNLLPDHTEQEAAEILRTLIAQRGSLPASELLSGLLPKRIGEVWVKAACGTAATPAAALLQNDRVQRQLLTLLRGRAFPVTGQAAFAQAQVTAGGIAGSCLTETLEARSLHGLYLCGELVDTDCDCGGYNLTWAWSSGLLAGMHAAKSTGRMNGK